MSAASRSEALDQAVGLSMQMADLGEAGDWEKVVELENIRGQLLKRVFASATTSADATMTARIKKILELDKKLISQGTDARAAIAKELSQTQVGRKATSAYSANR